MTQTPQQESLLFSRDENSPFSMLQSELDGKQGCIWRTRSLDEGNSSIHRSSDLQLGSEDGENAPTLHSSFDAALLHDKNRISGPLFEGDEKLDFNSSVYSGEDPALSDLTGKKHLLPRAGLETLETHSFGTVRKHARKAIVTGLSSKTPGRPRLRPLGSTKKSMGISTPSSALKRRRAPLHQRKSPMRQVVPSKATSTQLSAEFPQLQTNRQKQKVFTSNPTKSPKPQTPTLSTNDPSALTSTKKSLSKWYNTGTTATTALLETTFESDSVETSSPTTRRFRFTSFPESLPRVSNPRIRQCPDSMCKRMSFNETNNINALNQSRDDEGTHNTSISSLSADGGHHFPIHADRPPALLELKTADKKSSEGFADGGEHHLGPSHAQLFQYEENFGYSDDDEMDSPIRGDIGRTRLNFNMLLSPTSPQNDSANDDAGTPKEVCHRQEELLSPFSHCGLARKSVMPLDLNMELSRPYDHTRIHSFPSSLSSNTQMNITSSCDEIGATLTPARPFPKESPATPREVQLHFPPETECSPIPSGDDYGHLGVGAARNTGGYFCFFKDDSVTKNNLFGSRNTGNEGKQQDEDSTASESTSAKLRRLRPMPDMSAFESVVVSSRGDRSGDDSATLDSKGMQSSHRLLCPPTPVRTPAWASEGSAHAYGRQNSLITTKVLLACPSQVLEGRTSLETSILDDDSKASGSMSQSNPTGSEDVALQECAPDSKCAVAEIVSSVTSARKESYNTDLMTTTPQTRLPAPPKVMRPVSSSEEVGSVISFSRDFEVLRSLGSGAFADVYKVRSNRDRRMYAVKRNRRQFRGKRDRNMALAEVQYMQRLQNICAEPGTVSDKSSYSLYLLFFYRAWQEDGYFFCQIELCCRDTCRELLDSLRVFWNSSKTKYPSLVRNLPASKDIVAESGGDVSGRHLPNMTVWKICHDISAGLSHIHSHQLVHHDIKPSNIFIVPNSRFGAMCKIGDFGMAGDIGSSSDGQEGDTRYMPPELLSSITRKPSADIFSLGLTLYEVATEHHVEMPTEGPVWHELRSDAAPQLPEFRGNELMQLVKAMTDPCEQKRPTADGILQYKHVISAGHGCDVFLRDYLMDIESYDRLEEERLAFDRNEDQTPRNGSNRSGGALSPSLSMLLPTAPHLLSPVAHSFS
jgi:membrane-associated tyrosine/threonine-specific cdc2-inhibitory kinase